MNNFQKLFQTDVSGHVDKRKQGKTELSYLSWAWAWAQVNEIDENADYQIKMFADEKGLLKPWIHDPVLGYMVMTSVTILGDTKEMWLPVMDGANKAMLDHAYQYKTKYEVKTVEPASMFDINKTLMRCLVKNIAMFGLGLKLYAGEDLPAVEPIPEVKVEPLPEESKQKIHQAKDLESLRNVCRQTINELGTDYAQEIIKEFNIREKELKESKKDASVQLPPEK